MRRVRYNCAMSLDGYIADTNDGFDWIVVDPDIDFDELSAQFDTYLMGRRTFEVAGGQGPPTEPGMRNYVFSNSMCKSEYENIRVIGEDWREVVRSLRAETGKGYLVVWGRAAVREPVPGGAGRHGGSGDLAGLAGGRRAFCGRTVETGRVEDEGAEGLREDGDGSAGVRGRQYQ